MPYAWTEPELFTTILGVDIYHTYKDGNSRMSYWFTTNMADDDAECGSDFIFDVRSLRGFVEDSDVGFRSAMLRGLLCGEIQLPEEIELDANLTQIQACRRIAIVSDTHEDEPEAGMEVRSLLADLLHYCDALGYEFDVMLESARDYFIEERDPDCKDEG